MRTGSGPTSQDPPDPSDLSDPPDRRLNPPADALSGYGPLAATLRFATAAQATQATAERARLLETVLAHQGTLACKGSKPHIGALSPGCQACVEGRWSCLFVNGRCNCSCFYCPTAQTDAGPPTTNGLAFTKAREYAAYVDLLDFSGASLSGGEPFLTFDTSLAFVAALRRRLGPSVHLWLYTNGVLADADKLARLRDAGLDEIRFDIGATGYALTHLHRAVGVIPTVTVEIPAVPEEARRLRELLGPLADAGVDHLNLHQLRLTPFNLTRLAGCPYTFMRGDVPTVLESELLALELVAQVAQGGGGPPINYCSAVFKRRYQRAAARRRAAARMCKALEAITEAGYLRATSLSGNTSALDQATEALGEMPQAAGRWQRDPDRLRLDGALLPALLVALERAPPALALGGLDLRVAYSEAALRPSLGYRAPFVEIALGGARRGGRKVYIERLARGDTSSLSGVAIERFAAQLAGQPSDEQSNILETVPSELQRYH
jgi:pyruvate formate-lyase activating enzyme-like uncharacterized protein